MLKLSNGDILRNLQEQVLKNKEDIANHYAIDRNLANFGIKIVGTVASIEDLPGVTEFPLAPNYPGEYGDGYAVGEPGNYTYYIFTRPDLNAGKPTDYWLDVGQISVIGPQGPQGIQGEQGPVGQSTKWYSFTTPPQGGTYNEGDMAIVVQGQSVGNVYRHTNKAWTYTGNIRGPQGPQGPQGETGPQGPKGERGDVAGLVNIRGQLTNESQLPSPESLNNLTIAYLINGDLWIQFGETPQTATWNNVGPFNIGTLVSVNGNYVNTLEMNNYIAKPDSTFHSNRVPGILAGSLNQYYYTIAQSDQNSSTNTLVAYKDSSSGIKMPTAAPGYLTTANPINPYHCANKSYVDNKVEQLHPTPETVFEYTIAINPDQSAVMTYMGSQAIYNFRWMTISMDMGSNEYVTETLPITTISQHQSSTFKTTYPSKFTIQLDNLNSPTPTLTLTNLTGRVNGGARLNITCF